MRKRAAECDWYVIDAQLRCGNLTLSQGRVVVSVWFIIA